LSEYKKKRDAGKKKANFKTLGSNRATADNRDGQTTYLTAENLGVKVTVLAYPGSAYSAIPRSALMLISAMTITTQSKPLCMRGV
jgi:hypothetical protein